MSLEEAIRENTAAIKEQTALIQAGVSKAGGKAADTTEEKAPAKKAPAKKPAAKPKGKPTEDDLRTKFGGYLQSAGDKAGKKILTETVKPILDHFGKEKLTEIDEDDRAEAMGYADLLIAGFEADGLDGAQEVDLGLSNEEADDEDDPL